MAPKSSRTLAGMLGWTVGGHLKSDAAIVIVMIDTGANIQTKGSLPGRPVWVSFCRHGRHGAWRTSCGNQGNNYIKDAVHQPYIQHTKQV